MFLKTSDPMVGKDLFRIWSFFSRGMRDAKIIDIPASLNERKFMKTLTEILPEVEQLSDEDQAGLAAHLLARLRGAPLGPDDKELARRDAEIDAGVAELITFDELRKAVGR